MSAPPPNVPNASPSTQSAPPTAPARARRGPKTPQRKGGRRKGAKNIAWAKIRLAYIQGVSRDGGPPELPSYPDLAREFGVPMGAIGKVAADEGWPKLRAEYQSKLNAEIQLKSIESIAQTVAIVAAKSASTCGVVLDRIASLVRPKPQPDTVGQIGLPAPEPEITEEAIEKAQALSVVYRNLCQGTRLLVGGGQTAPTQSAPGAVGEVERDPPMSPEAQAVADLVVKAAAGVNRAPTASGASEAPPGMAED